MRDSLRGYLFSATAVIAVLAQPSAAAARAQVYRFNIPSQALGNALKAFGETSRQQIIFDATAVNGKKSPALVGSYSKDEALSRLLANTGLGVTTGKSGVLIVRPTAATPEPVQSRPVAGNAPTTPAAELDDNSDIIVTAQKKEESLKDVPIAITAFSKQSLDDHKIESGSELLRAVPNVNFSKGNFSMYNFSIRGIGTKAISASSDPAVAVSFNNTPLIRNRLFESEFFDLQRVEVLRGPQGTLYGRNATGGVVNIIPALPSDTLEGEAKAEVGSYDTTRLSGMLNVPLGDTLAVRVAGAMTKRDGFDFNTFTQKRVNDRDLWSTRGSVQWEPSDRFKANAIWQHFEEEDHRSRTGKQLCARDEGPEMVGSTVVPEALRPRISQGCMAVSLYDDRSFGAPNGNILGYVVLPSLLIDVAYDPNTFETVKGIVPGDPYGNVVQSRNLREIATSYDPVFRAKNDVFQLNLEFKFSDSLKLISQTAYARDRYYSSQDYNRFVSSPVFSDTRGLVDIFGNPIGAGPTPGGFFTDPQLGTSNRILSADLSRSRNDQWTQEIRLQSSFNGPFNFSFGANYLHFKSQDDYYVFNNLFTYAAQNFYNRVGDTFNAPCPAGTSDRDCIYIDPNPIGSVNDQGHNYFLSRNIVKTESWAVFGEAYWNVADNIKITAGLRFTKDNKTATPVPSQLLLGGAPDLGNSGGYTNSGYPALPNIEQKWGRPTGRLVVDWKPNLSFTDDTLIYASASHGYKGGGANPPRADINPRVVQYQPLATTFKPEYVNAFEIGTKNSFADGKLSLNATAFFYDYKDYQVSQIVDRISLNENFDAQSWGLEFEAAWRPSRAFRIDTNLGYLRTRLKKGARSIDVMNRTQGNSDWVVLRPWIQVPSNCIAPREHVEAILNSPFVGSGLDVLMLGALCGGSRGFGSFDPNVETGLHYDQFLGFTYNPLTDAPNGGRGFYADLEGNELPNAPRLTFNVGAQYTFFIDDWNLTFRGDYYRQSASWGRVYNTAYDRLKPWDNTNLAITFARPESDLAFQFYIKNVFNNTPISDFFTNSDDTGLSTNVFTLDPRIIGFSVSKRF
ncbi:TonB-dependent receptor [Sphingomonas sp. So64.6b]|uniref:TonB-dependent receptor domain-containing protein n=1 Tax=Sphingomonas sp. So64.6b TaxID=2997354 RepID=UPI001602EC51|nr:TonB-dependent receptor [Sphingomonas sp. So64.6b]QNA82618.1 TonB-dependent receptor [Sphingomonas sp. So64.6b]